MTDNPCVRSALRILEGMAKAFDPGKENHAYVAGGIAVAWWLGGERTTKDLDVVFDGDILPGVEVSTRDGDVFLDWNFSDTLSLVEEDYFSRSVEVAVFGPLHVHMLAPVDLVLMKASRASPKDMADISGLVRKDLVNKKEFLALAESALVIYVGHPGPVRDRIAEIAAMFPKEGTCPSFRP